VASVHRLLKTHDLNSSPAYIVMIPREVTSLATV